MFFVRELVNEDDIFSTSTQCGKLHARNNKLHLDPSPSQMLPAVFYQACHPVCILHIYIDWKFGGQKFLRI